MGVGPLDLDGTLTDSEVGIARSVQYALRRAGVNVAGVETLTPYIGSPLQDSFVALAGFSETDAIRAVASYREYFAETGISENRVYPGIPECLEALQAQGWLAVATSKPTVFAERILDHFSLLTHFQAPPSLKTYSSSRRSSMETQGTGQACDRRPLARARALRPRSPGLPTNESTRAERRTKVAIRRPSFRHASLRQRIEEPA